MTSSRCMLQKKFKDIPIGQCFQLVNSVMGAAMTTGPKFRKTSTTEAERIGEGLVIIDPDSLVELS